jgi:plastocyanin
MRRFRLVGFYVAGLVAVIGLAVGAVSARRLAADAGTPQAQEIRTDAPSARGPARSPVKVSIADFVFELKELTVPAGTAVTWVNADDVPHTVTSTASPPLFGSQALATNDTFSFVFKRAGTYGYFCNLHPAMTGKVVVK